MRFDALKCSETVDWIYTMSVEASARQGPVQQLISEMLLEQHSVYIAIKHTLME